MNLYDRSKRCKNRGTASAVYKRISMTNLVVLFIKMSIAGEHNCQNHKQHNAESSGLSEISRI